MIFNKTGRPELPVSRVDWNGSLFLCAKSQRKTAEGHRIFKDTDTIHIHPERNPSSDVEDGGNIRPLKMRQFCDSI